MHWELKNWRDQTIAQGTGPQIVLYLQSLVRDGDSKLVGPGCTLQIRRYRGILHPERTCQDWLHLEHLLGPQGNNGDP